MQGQAGSVRSKNGAQSGTQPMNGSQAGPSPQMMQSIRKTIEDLPRYYYSKSVELIDKTAVQLVYLAYALSQGMENSFNEMDQQEATNAQIQLKNSDPFKAWHRSFEDFIDGTLKKTISLLKAYPIDEATASEPKIKQVGEKMKFEAFQGEANSAGKQRVDYICWGLREISILLMGARRGAGQSQDPLSALPKKRKMVRDTEDGRKVTGRTNKTGNTQEYNESGLWTNPQSDRATITEKRAAYWGQKSSEHSKLPARDSILRSRQSIENPAPAKTIHLPRIKAAGLRHSKALSARSLDRNLSLFHNPPTVYQNLDDSNQRHTNPTLRPFLRARSLSKKDDSEDLDMSPTPSPSPFKKSRKAFKLGESPKEVRPIEGLSIRGSLKEARLRRSMMKPRKSEEIREPIRVGPAEEGKIEEGIYLRVVKERKVEGPLEAEKIVEGAYFTVEKPVFDVAGINQDALVIEESIEEFKKDIAPVPVSFVVAPAEETGELEKIRIVKAQPILHPQNCKENLGLHFYSEIEEQTINFEEEPTLLEEQAMDSNKQDLKQAPPVENLRESPEQPLYDNVAPQPEDYCEETEGFTYMRPAPLEDNYAPEPEDYQEDNEVFRYERPAQIDDNVAPAPEDYCEEMEAFRYERPAQIDDNVAPAPEDYCEEMEAFRYERPTAVDDNIAPEPEDYCEEMEAFRYERPAKIDDNIAPEPEDYCEENETFRYERPPLQTQKTVELHKPSSLLDQPSLDSNHRPPTPLAPPLRPLSPQSTVLIDSVSASLRKTVPPTQLELEPIACSLEQGYFPNKTKEQDGGNLGPLTDRPTEDKANSGGGVNCEWEEAQIERSPTPSTPPKTEVVQTEAKNPQQAVKPVFKAENTEVALLLSSSLLQ